MRFVVTADGVAPIRLGMGRQDAGLALIEWGEPQPFRRGSEHVAGWIVERSSTTVFVYCDDDERVEAIEFASPGHGQPADDEVMFENVDLFVDPADVVIANLSAKGHAITHEQNGFASTLPDVLLALWRDGEPRDEATGLPLYFESALVARPGYDGQRRRADWCSAAGLLIGHYAPMVDAWRVQDSTQPIDATAAISLLRSRLRSGRCETWFESDSGELLAVVTSGERAMVMLLREPGDAGEHAVDELKLVSSVIKGRERTPSKWRLDR